MPDLEPAVRVNVGGATPEQEHSNRMVHRQPNLLSRREALELMDAKGA